MLCDSCHERDAVVHLTQIENNQVTQLRQIPANSVINALHGTLKLISAAPAGSGQAHDAAAKGKKHKKAKTKTQTGNFGGECRNSYCHRQFVDTLAA